MLTEANPLEASGARSVSGNLPPAAATGRFAAWLGAPGATKAEDALRHAAPVMAARITGLLSKVCDMMPWEQNSLGS